MSPLEEVQEFLDFWEEFAKEIYSDTPEDSCDPPHPVEDDPDLLVAEYHQVRGTHKLFASKIQTVCDELRTLRAQNARLDAPVETMQESAEL